MGLREAAGAVDRYFAANYTQYGPYRPVGVTILREAQGNIDPALACALVEKESGGRNIFGCDWGAKWTTVPPFCNVAVTKERVAALIKNVEDGGGQNGVGLTQLTSIEFVRQAERMGGAHIPRNQCRVGFRLLRDLINTWGYDEGIAAYNAGPGNRHSVLHTYAADVVLKHAQWKQRINHLLGNPAELAPKPTYDVRIEGFTHRPTAERVAQEIRSSSEVRLPAGKKVRVGKAAGPGDSVDLSRYTPRPTYGLTAHSDRVCQDLEARFGPFARVVGRVTGNLTGHADGRGIDLWWTSEAQADAVLAWCVRQRGPYALEGITARNSQIGYPDLGYSDWSGWKHPQWFAPPAGWEKDGDFGIADPGHHKHGHLQLQK